MVAVGIAGGFFGAWSLSRLAQSLLFDVRPRSFRFGAAILTIAAVGLLAAVIPARRAARIEPMVALRQE